MPSTLKRVLQLPKPRLNSGASIEHCLRERRSCRCFAGRPAELADAAQLLWAAQGVTGLGGLRTAPSAGAIYPLRIYLVAMNIQGLRAGAYSYDPDANSLGSIKSGDLRLALQEAVFDQGEVEDAALAILISANYRRSKQEFGENGIRLAHMEAGHVAQNVCLQSTALGLGVIGMGKIDAPRMRALVELPETEEPLYLLLAGPK